MKPGFYPFWFLNDRLDDATIRQQIQQMHAQGVKGFFLHPRQGLEQPYMSDSFLQCLESAIDEARKLGMIANLYDEYPYPSGVAGGEVLLGNPQWWGTTLKHDLINLDGGPQRRTLPIGKVLSCKAFPCQENGDVNWQQAIDLRSSVGVHLGDHSFNVGGLTPYNRKRYFASNPTPVLETTLPAGRWRLVTTVQAVITGHKYWDHFVDVMNPEAVRAFIDLTHERYWQRFGKYFGNVIRGIFVDEVCAAWSYLLPPRFQQEMNYDILAHLEAVADPDHPRHWQVNADLARVKHVMFCESFDEPIRDWCRDHDIAYCGEKTSFRYSQLAYLDIPGCEPGHTKVGAPQVDTLQSLVRGNARATAAAAYFYDKPGSLCECFHSLGWSGTMQDAKSISENLLLLGISYLVPHGFFYSTHSLKKHDAPPTFFFQMPYWQFFGKLSQRLEKITDAFADTWIDAETAVLDHNAGMPSKQDRQVAETLYQELMSNQVEFTIVDTDILAKAKAANGSLTCRDLTIGQILVPPMQAPEPEWQQLAEQFRQQGITCLEINCAEQARDIAKACAQKTPTSLAFTVVSGNRGKLWLTARRNQQRRVWFLQNLGAEPMTLAFAPAMAAMLQEIILDEQAGQTLLIDDHGVCQCHLDGFASALLCDQGGVPAARPLPTVTATLPLFCSVTPLQSNLLRLGRWRLAIRQEEDTSWGAEAEVDTIPIANQLKQSRLPFRPIFAEGSGSMPRMQFPSLQARYETTFFYHCQAPVSLVLEPGSVAGTSWRLEVNGCWQAGAEDLRPAPENMHLPGCASVDITAALKPGVNHLAIFVQANRADHGLCNPLYLAGDFSIDARSLTLTEPLWQGKFEQYESNGLPFYAGSIIYSGNFQAGNLPGTSSCLLQLQLPVACEEALEISLNNQQWLSLPWRPHQAIIPTAWLQEGHNNLQVKVSTTLIRSFEGERFDLQKHCHVKVN